MWILWLLGLFVWSLTAQATLLRPCWAGQFTYKLYLGRLSPLKRLTSTCTHNFASNFVIQRKGRMTVRNISCSVSAKECCRTRRGHLPNRRFRFISHVLICEVIVIRVLFYKSTNIYILEIYGTNPVITRLYHKITGQKWLSKPCIDKEQIPNAGLYLVSLSRELLGISTTSETDLSKFYG